MRRVKLSAGEPLTEAPAPLWAIVTIGRVELETAPGRVAVPAGGALLVDEHTAYRLFALDDAEVIIADLTSVVPSHPLPSPLIVPTFSTDHVGIAAMVRLCPLTRECRPGLFAASYAGMIGTAMTAAWLDHTQTADATPQTDSVVSDLLTALVDRPDEPWSLDRMARSTHLSRSAFSDRFRRATGRSPMQVLRDVRMQAARRMLLESRPVTHIAFAVGYGSVAAFSRAFSSHHGVAPQFWRASMSSRRRDADRGEPESSDDRGHRADQQGDLDAVSV